MSIRCELPLAGRRGGLLVFELDSVKSVWKANQEGMQLQNRGKIANRDVNTFS
jgi:hypothetical protein